MYKLILFNYKNSIKLQNNFIISSSGCYGKSKYYHSENGVFGYKVRDEIKEKVCTSILEKRNQHSNIFRWVEAYRTHGHRIANVNPIEIYPSKRDQYLEELQSKHYGLDNAKKIDLNGILYNEAGIVTVEQLQQTLEKIYCSNSVSVEFSYVENEFEREWIAKEYESIVGLTLPANDKFEIGELMLKCQAWDKFLATKFPTVKRYGGEGAESMLAFFRQILLCSTDNDIQNIVLAMPHRGKLNFLTTMLKTHPAKIFRKFKGQPEFQSNVQAMCDIPHHFNASVDLDYNNKKIHFSMVHNPSHLEAGNPVAMGKTLSKQSENETSLNLILHGDAAFAGQGINQECLFMSGTPNFDIGGTIHLIVNNQVGFTTPGDRGRITRYASDLAKSINAPVFHVNADNPEMLSMISKLAFEYNKKFRKDVFIDLNCFRRWGHNEMDDPTFTNPALYKIIHNRKSIPDLYAEKLVNEKVMTEENVKTIVGEHMAYLTSELNNWENYIPEASYFEKKWNGIQQASNMVTTWNTGVDYNILHYVGKMSVSYPKNFAIHPHLLKTYVTSRLKKLEDGKNIDWATAESLAFGSLMYQGHNIRISGEDVGRGTFSHRHAMLVDQNTNNIHIPLNSIDGGLGGKLEVANSILSEEAVLGFEYGYAIDNPQNLVIWEAQFGDFFNGAQIIFDTYILSGETKWMFQNGMVILLPHGYDGAASEHSSCRLERFLQMTDSKETSPDGDNVNFNLIVPTTPAQYFHALRRQIIRNFRKPLIVVAPKTLLRLSDAVSTHEDFKSGTTYQSVIGDNIVEPKNVIKVILCSGKHYYNLNAERIKRGLKNVAIVRIESLCPFPCEELNIELDKYKKATEFIWSQEEHRNMGAWTFVKPRFENLLARRIKYCGRYEAATPAVGVSSWHTKEVADVINSTFS